MNVVKSPTKQATVTILLKNLNEYRVSLYDLLRRRLGEEDITLRLVTASGLSEDAAKGDQATLPWAEHRSFREIRIAGSVLLWQPGFDLARSSDLVITEQASKQLFNLVLAFGQRALGTRHAFWGHGRNFQQSLEDGSGERLKRLLTRRAHWFFAYNEVSALAAIEAGMPAARVTPVMNSTDTAHIRRVLSDSAPADEIRRRHGFGTGPLGLFMGGVYRPKRPDFLIAAAREIRDRVPDFELVVIGDGSERSTVSEAAEQEPWIHWLGARYGDDRLEPASVCDVQLMPGMVGLNIVDALAMGIPTITTDLDYHSPEIEYLRTGENGLSVRSDASPANFGREVAALLADRPRLDAMRREAARTGEELSIEDMAERFTAGVVAALAAPAR